MSSEVPSPGSASYWDHRYTSIGPEQVSWFQDEPAVSLELIQQSAPPSAGVVDLGGGASRLVDHLLSAGFGDVTIVDLSQEALSAAHQRVGEASVTWVVSDVRDWHPHRTFDVWHDRAAYHFLTDQADQEAYWALVRESVPLGGHVVMATFAPGGPQRCSGLPVVRYGADELAAAMGEGFTVQHTRHEDHSTPSGLTQGFTWLLAERT